MALTSHLFGPDITDTGILFKIWAPLSPQVHLECEGLDPVLMEGDREGWHRVHLEGAKPGCRYRFRLADGLAVPDPASRYQPEDVHGPSEVVDLGRFDWNAEAWSGRPWEETVIYELHVGAFSEKGTFLGMLDKLDHLESLGITAIQLMPINEFPGRWNWGYDGVLPYAPDCSYGRPEDLMRLIDEAHLRGISVFLDVVYNHFGPDGNYLPAHAPLFTDKHSSPWGDGINLDDEGNHFVRQYLIENALYWLGDYRFDGLRFDAVHAIHDDSPVHFLDELAQRIRQAFPRRHVHLIVENERNDATLLERDVEGRPKTYTAQWNDDIHHALHALTTGETTGYFADYEGGASILGKALAEGFVFQGEIMPHKGKRRGSPSAHLPPTAFVSFIHNHDQIGNRARGDRIMADLEPQALRFAVALYLLAPQVPMLFMGEEWRSRRPFPYFSDFHAELNRQVKEGRKEELIGKPGFEAENMLDPTSDDTFSIGKLDWFTPGQSVNEAWVSFYRELLDRRLSLVVPLIGLMDAPAARFSLKNDVLVVSWPLHDGRDLRLVANPSENELLVGEGVLRGSEIFSLSVDSNGRMRPWALSFRLVEQD
ncbi:malto-oligosyltrehalose trehalohydrolase [Rhizobium sp. AAP43]|uniref:malto-oligosyltrehalose trehalohydrolase n=1 Tax=Rhizobium sp. AAP43 TaxID=1523420 RepID=UPI0006CDA16E|nr:malto-oligosyltrehalose trehalohydrolase [Rhizobium sp. AAP43]KPF41315.1 1,4-alpha-glucan branching protein [Rhizobium sp. AAP43]